MKIVPALVQYVDHMGDDLAVVNAARVSFDKESDWEVIAEQPFFGNAVNVVEQLSAQDTKLINYLAKHSHWSPFAHTTVKLRIKDPIFVARQLVKHQVGGVWNEVSRRYVDDQPEFWLPEVWRARPDGSIKQGSAGPHPQSDYFDSRARQVLMTALGAYNDMIEAGVAPEQARIVLPLCTHTEWIWTGSLMFWARVCRERLAKGAQLETRDTAEQIVEIVAPLFPVSWSALMGVGDAPH